MSLAWIVGWAGKENHTWGSLWTRGYECGERMLFFGSGKAQSLDSFFVIVRRLGILCLHNVYNCFVIHLIVSVCVTAVHTILLFYSQYITRFGVSSPDPRYSGRFRSVCMPCSARWLLAGHAVCCDTVAYVPKPIKGCRCHTFRIIHPSRGLSLGRV